MNVHAFACHICINNHHLHHPIFLVHLTKKLLKIYKICDQYLQGTMVPVVRSFRALNINVLKIKNTNIIKQIINTTLKLMLFLLLINEIVTFYTIQMYNYTYRQNKKKILKKSGSTTVFVIFYTFFNPSATLISLSPKS